MLLVTSCKHEPTLSLDAFKNLNGYWQVDKVVFANGAEKPFKTSPVVDFIAIQENQGYKKKVYPKLSGTYQTSNDAVNFMIHQKKNGQFVLSYSDGAHTWTETILTLKTNSFSFTNQEGVTYIYKRYQPIELDVK